MPLKKTLASAPLQAASGASNAVVVPSPLFKPQAVPGPVSESAFFLSDSDVGALSQLPPLFSGEAMLSGDLGTLSDMIASMRMCDAYHIFGGGGGDTRQAPEEEGSTNAAESSPTSSLADDSTAALNSDAVPSDDTSESGDISGTLQWPASPPRVDERHGECLGVGSASVAANLRDNADAFSKRNTNSLPQHRGMPANMYVTPVGAAAKPPTLAALPVGSDLNTPASGWVPEVKRPWNPVSSAFSMVDMVATLMEEHRCSAGDKTAHQNVVPSAGEALLYSLPRAGNNVSTAPDIVCPAEQLKRILLSQVSGTPLAFVAHRIGPSVVIEGSLQPPLRTVREARAEALKAKTMYFSILADEETKGVSQNNSDSDSTKRSGTDDDATTFRQDYGTAATDTNPSAAFRKSLHWAFDNLSVLLGVDTPTVSIPPRNSEELTMHFVDVSGRQAGGGKGRPQLTKDECLDVWLDAIMANVDGVALCYHSDGIVEGCQVVSTAHIPNLSETRFEPIAIQREARNVLNWLKTSCARSGGSYVVLKERNGTMLRLFDISDFGHPAAHNPQPSAEPFNRGVTGRCLEDDSTSRQPTASPQPLSAIDDDVSSTAEPSTSLARRHAAVSAKEVETMRAFTFPVAMMCLRMAQGLPNSDAETLRLLQKAIALFEELECVDIKEDGEQRPGSGCSATRFAVSPVVFPLLKSHTLCVRHYHSSSPLPDAERMCVVHAQKALEYAGRLQEANWEWLELHCNASGLPESKGATFRKAQEDEVDTAVSEIVRIMGALASQKLKAKKLIDVIEIIGVCQEAVHLRRHVFSDMHDPSSEKVLSLQWLPEAVIGKRRHEVLAAVLHLETLCGDFLWVLDSELEKVQERPSGAQVGESVPESCVSTSALTASTHITSFLMHASVIVARLRRGFKHGSQFDFVGRLCPVPAAAVRLQHASDAFERATRYAQQVALHTRELIRKQAAIVTQAANRCAAASDRASLVSAKGLFHKAVVLFRSVDDPVNTLMMSLNESKMSLRLAKQVKAAWSTPTEIFLQDIWQPLHDALEATEETLNWIADHTPPFDSDDVGKLVLQTHAHNANLLLLWYGELSANDPIGVELAKQFCFLLPLATAPVSLNKFCAALEGIQQEHQHEVGLEAQKLVEDAVHDMFFAPALRHAKKSGLLALELHILKVAYQFHMAHAGVPHVGETVHLQHATLCPSPHQNIDLRVTSVRHAVGRCRQFFTRIGAETAGGVGITVAAHRREIVVVAIDLFHCYEFLWKHPLAVLSQATSRGEDAVTALTTPDEVELDFIERAATTLCAVTPVLEELSRSEATQSSPLTELLSRISAAVTALCLRLLRHLRRGTSSNVGRENALREIANTAMNAVQGDDVAHVLRNLEHLFEGRKKIAAKVF